MTLLYSIIVVLVICTPTFYRLNQKVNVLTERIRQLENKMDANGQ